jgi:hypothetical protein
MVDQMPGVIARCASQTTSPPSASPARTSSSGPVNRTGPPRAAPLSCEERVPGAPNRQERRFAPTWDHRHRKTTPTP